jgi:glutamate transport system substrate-binding protein
MRSKSMVALALIVVQATILGACTSSATPSTPSQTTAPSGGTSFQAGTDMARISSAKALTVAVKYDVPGFGLTGLSQTPSGFDIEIAKLIAGQLGVDPSNIKYIEGVATLREQFLQRHEADFVIATYTMNAERSKSVSFAGPYYIAGQQMMVAATDTSLTGPDSLKTHPDAKVCTNSGSTPAENIKPYLANAAQLVLFDVVSKCADALKTGQVQAVTDDNVNLIGLVAQSQGAFKLAGPVFTAEPFGIGVPLGDVAFCNFIDATLSAAAQNGQYAAAWKATAGLIPGAVTPTLPAFAPCGSDAATWPTWHQ